MAVRDSFSLKALIQAKKQLSQHTDDAGQTRDNTQKTLSHGPDAVGQAKLAYYYHGIVVPPLTPDSLPDYAAWCADWWRGCFACPDFLPDKVRFCRKWNRAFYGVDVVSVASMSTDDHPCPQGQNETTGQGDALSPRQTGGAWWCGRKEAAA